MSISGQARVSSTSAARAPGETPSTRRRAVDGIPWTYGLVFLLGTALVAGFMWYHIGSERRVALEHWRARMSTVADDRARLISAWLNGRRADAEVLASFPSVRALLAGNGNGDTGPAVTAHLDRVAHAYGYASIALVDRQGRVVARSAGSGELGSTVSELGAAAVRTGGLRIDLPSDAPKQILSFAVPVETGGRGEARTTLGAVVIRMNPVTGLFSLLAEESVPTRTGEILLFRMDGDGAYLSPLRHPNAGWAARLRSLEILRARTRAGSPEQETHAIQTAEGR